MSKSYNDYTLAELIAKPYFLIKPDSTLSEELQEEDKNEQLAVLSYISKQADLYGVSLTDMHALPIFGDKEKKNRLTVDYKRIDALLTDAYNTKVLERKAYIVDFVTANKDKIVTNVLSPDKLLAKLDRGVKDLSAVTDEIAKYSSILTEKQTDRSNLAYSMQEEYDAYMKAVVNGEPSVPLLFEQLTKISENLPLKMVLSEVYDNTVCCLFEIEHDIIVGERNPLAYVDYKVNLGKFGIFLRLSLTGHVVERRAYPLGNNLLVQGNFHPHIASDFLLCYGDVLKAVTDASVEGNVFEVLRLTYSLINSYSPTNPYELLFSYHKRAEAKKSQRFSNTRLIDYLCNRSAVTRNRLTRNILTPVINKTNQQVDITNASERLDALEQDYRSVGVIVPEINLEGADTHDLVVIDKDVCVVVRVDTEEIIDLPKQIIFNTKCECLYLPLRGNDPTVYRYSLTFSRYTADAYVTAKSIKVEDQIVFVGSTFYRQEKVHNAELSPIFIVVELFSKYTKTDGSVVDNIAVVRKHGTSTHLCMDLNDINFKTILTLGE